MAGREWTIAAFLLWNSLKDLRSRTISIISIVGFGIAGILWAFAAGDINWIKLLAGLVPGLVLLGISLLSPQAVGCGDGLALLVVGIYCGFSQALASLFWGLLFSAASGIILLITKKGKKETEIPFIPFLMIGFLLQKFWN